MNQAELLEELSQILENLEIQYLITGSVATIAYGEPRFTNDIDVVVRLFPFQVDGLCAAFPASDFYLSPETVNEAVEKYGQLNILHPASGLKIDVMVADTSDFNESRFARARRLQVTPARDVTFASPEDVIIKKLVFFQEGGSEKHLRDIRGVLAVMGDGIDRDYIDKWISALGLTAEWSAVLGE